MYRVIMSKLLFKVMCFGDVLVFLEIEFENRSCRLFDLNNSLIVRTSQWSLNCLLGLKTVEHINVDDFLKSCKGIALNHVLYRGEHLELTYRHSLLSDLLTLVCWRIH